ncbi:MAG: tRNA (uridine(34)/cytosine(34)/5-carboxymethylaminomethyluridine(34)-2'-O)-methyltransferase TrmL [Tissierellales bacterium]|jgi:tRNA (cytidine/uridine-2'-O-)-methyltransferase|nr:tRNA (uridine(34)/cytosine(34)/5-carboxymethylaminomethyluridine(34)-2'-O)-methyltransferase TrmL [Tissierellales bacterium]
MGINIVLIEPEIPQNTGNIARTCALTGASLHLVKPLGFSVNDKYLKRAGLDYWHLLDITYHDSFQELLDKVDEGKFFYATTKGGTSCYDVDFMDDCYIVFGKETAGIPESLLNQYKDQNIRIPMLKNEAARSLNLSNSVAIIAYEAMRQLGCPGLV